MFYFVKFTDKLDLAGLVIMTENFWKAYPSISQGHNITTQSNPYLQLSN